MLKDVVLGPDIQGTPTTGTSGGAGIHAAGAYMGLSGAISPEHSLSIERSTRHLRSEFRDFVSHHLSLGFWERARLPESRYS